MSGKKERTRKQIQDALRQLMREVCMRMGEKGLFGFGHWEELVGDVTRRPFDVERWEDGS